MEILVEGHKYGLKNFDNPNVSQTIGFINKRQVAGKLNELQTVEDGTTNEEVLAMLINRLNYLHTKLPDDYTHQAINKCQEALTFLELRTTDRKNRNVEGTPQP